jgi:hypothetical protein
MNTTNLISILFLMIASSGWRRPAPGSGPDRFDDSGSTGPAVCVSKMSSVLVRRRATVLGEDGPCGSRQPTRPGVARGSSPSHVAAKLRRSVVAQRCWGCVLRRDADVDLAYERHDWASAVHTVCVQDTAARRVAAFTVDQLPARSVRAADAAGNDRRTTQPDDDPGRGWPAASCAVRPPSHARR